MLAFPAAGTVNGSVVLAPGDVNLTFKEYVRSEVRLTIEDARACPLIQSFSIYHYEGK